MLLGECRSSGLWVPKGPTEVLPRQNTFDLWAEMAERLIGMPTKTVSLFLRPLTSAFLHAIMLMPNFNSIRFGPWLIYFGAQAVGVQLKRAFYLETGKRVKGWVGWC